MSEVWTNRLVSFAYQYQQEAAPFVEMMNVFAGFMADIEPKVVMDVGCGSGRIIRLLLDELAKKPVEVVALDVSKHALRYAQKSLHGYADKVKMYFAEQDISSSDAFDDYKYGCFDLITAGLSLQYAEHTYYGSRKWTRKRYKEVFSDLYHCLCPGGRLVFSNNLPNPNFAVIARESRQVIFSKWHRAPILLFAAMIMVNQAKKLTQMANAGRYHYLPIEVIIDFLDDAGYDNIRFQKTYGGLAWVVSCQK